MHKEVWRKKVMVDCIKTYGKYAQLDIAAEELAELIQAIMKHKRANFSFDSRIALIDEVADVTIMLEQLKMMISCLDSELQTRMDEELTRQEQRIAAYRESEEEN